MHLNLKLKLNKFLFYVIDSVKNLIKNVLT